VAAVPVTIADAQQRDVPIYLEGLGTVQASNTVAVRSQIDGKLLSVNFVEGQEVHQGDTLATIDPRTLQAALAQAQAKKAQDEAQLVAAQKDLERFQTLARKSFETQQNLDQQQAKVDQLKATIDADQGAIESAQTQLSYATITAPFDGRVGFRQLDAGNVIHASDTNPLTVLTQIRPVVAIFTLPEKNLAAVREAMLRGPVPVTALDQDNAQERAQGTLLLIDNQSTRRPAPSASRRSSPTRTSTFGPASSSARGPRWPRATTPLPFRRAPCSVGRTASMFGWSRPITPPSSAASMRRPSIPTRSWSTRASRPASTS
jgi:multidrug efflux system membrane fusion protein